MSGYVGSKRSSSLVSATEITLDGAKLKSSGDSITKSDGTTAVLSESGGVVTLNNGTIGSGVVFPAGHKLELVYSNTDNTAYTITSGEQIILSNTSSYSSGDILFLFGQVSAKGATFNNSHAIQCYIKKDDTIIDSSKMLHGINSGANVAYYGSVLLFHSETISSTSSVKFELAVSHQQGSTSINSSTYGSNISKFQIYKTV